MKKVKIILLIFISLFLTLFFSSYQRITGPTYPYKVKMKFLEKEFSFKLPRSQNSGEKLKILLPVKESFIKADLFYQNYSEDGQWEKKEFERTTEGLYAELKPLPPAGKYFYYVKFYYLDKSVQIPEKPISIRFKGKVPTPILLLHIILIFSAFFLSIYTGLYTIFFEKKEALVLATFILTLIGAGILGPVVQKYAFGEFWTGFPFGKDLTDNKGLIMIIFWAIAWVQIRRGKGKEWVLLAFFISILVFFIPHSLWGSELKGGVIKTGP